MAGCSTTTGLSRCSACRTVRYCSREHQAAHRPAHKAACTKIKKALRKLEAEELELIEEEGDDIFTEEKGRFWGIYETRPYMRARYDVVEALLKVNTVQAVTTALENHLLEMLHLSRGDNMGVRDQVPALLLRLGRLQEAYDFCMWWATIEQDTYYDWGDTSLPYLDTKGADVFGSVEAFTARAPFLNVSHSVAVTLIKIRLLFDVQALQKATEEVGPRVPHEILAHILRYVPNSNISYGTGTIGREDHALLIPKLQGQIRKLFAGIKESNPHFWPALSNPGENLTARPITWSFGSKSHMQLTLQYNYNSWAETPGAIGIIEELLRQ